MRLNVPVFVGIAGFCSLALGLLCASLIFPKLENYLIEKATALEEGTSFFETWRKIPFPFKFKIYIFNVTNPDEVQTGAKPVLKEIGPYIYDEFRERDILLIDEENDTIRYIQRKHFFFNSEESGCRSDDDIVTIIHFALVSMAHKVNKISPMVLPLLNEALPFLFPNIKNMFITNSVRNILFDGLAIMCDSDETDMICDSIKSKLPHTMRIDNNARDLLLSLFNHVNGTNDGPYEIGRGLKSTIKGNIVTFKEKHVLTEWDSEECNKIQGTDLTINPRLEETPEKINFFVPDFCRSFSVKFQQEVKYLGLQTYNFETTHLFQNQNFCQNGYNMEGTMDLGLCTGSPVVISHPHFLNGEKSLHSFIQGLKPNPKKHGTCVIMEPRTGLALKVRARFQMNIFLKRYEEIGVFGNVTEGLFPFIWLENSADVPPHIIEEVQNNFNKLKIFNFVKYILIGSGVVLLGVSLLLALVKDKIVCFWSRRNVVSDGKNDAIGRYLNSYSDLKIYRGSQVPNHRDTWRITN